MHGIARAARARARQARTAQRTDRRRASAARSLAGRGGAGSRSVASRSGEAAVKRAPHRSRRLVSKFDAACQAARFFWFSVLRRPGLITWGAWLGSAPPRNAFQ